MSVNFYLLGFMYLIHGKSNLHLSNLYSWSLYIDEIKNIYILGKEEMCADTFF